MQEYREPATAAVKKFIADNADGENLDAYETMRLITFFEFVLSIGAPTESPHVVAAAFHCFKGNDEERKVVVAKSTLVQFLNQEEFYRESEVWRNRVQTQYQEVADHTKRVADSLEELVSLMKSRYAHEDEMAHRMVGG